MDPYIHIDEILPLFKSAFGIEMLPQNLYYYINKRGFPRSTGWGNPRKFFRAEVLNWFKENKVPPPSLKK